MKNFFNMKHPNKRQLCIWQQQITLETTPALTTLRPSIKTFFPASFETKVKDKILFDIELQRYLKIKWSLYTSSCFFVSAFMLTNSQKFTATFFNQRDIYYVMQIDRCKKIVSNCKTTNCNQSRRQRIAIIYTIRISVQTVQVSDFLCRMYKFLRTVTCSQKIHCQVPTNKLHSKRICIFGTVLTCVQHCSRLTSTSADEQNSCLILHK